MAKLHLGLSIFMGIFQVDQQPTSSMMMAKLNLGFSMTMIELHLGTLHEKRTATEGCRYRTSSELGNSVLEINHVTNVTKFLMRLRPQIGYLALPHAQYYDFSDRKDRIGQPK